MRVSSKQILEHLLRLSRTRHSLQLLITKGRESEWTLLSQALVPLNFWLSWKGSCKSAVYRTWTKAWEQLRLNAEQHMDGATGGTVDCGS